MAKHSNSLVAELQLDIRAVKHVTDFISGILVKQNLVLSNKPKAIYSNMPERSELNAARHPGMPKPDKALSYKSYANPELLPMPAICVSAAGNWAQGQHTTPRRWGLNQQQAACQTITVAMHKCSTHRGQQCSQAATLNTPAQMQGRDALGSLTEAHTRRVDQHVQSVLTHASTKTQPINKPASKNCLRAVCETLQRI